MSEPALVPPVPQGVNIGGQIAAMGNIFVDPASAALEMPRKLSWLLPFVLISALGIACAIAVLPLTMRVMEQYPPEGVSAEQMQQSVAMIKKFQSVGIVATPFFLAVKTAIAAAILLGICSVMSIRSNFSSLFSLLIYTSLIPMLQAVAGVVVLKAKENDIQSIGELTPRFGLDLFIQNPKVLRGLLNYFSIFNIWYIIVLAIAFAALTKISRGKAFAATAPVWIISMLLAVIGSLFSKS